MARAAVRHRLHRASFPGSVRNSSSGSVYEAGANTRRTFGWRAPEIAPNNAVLYSLDTLRNRSRAAVRNDGYAFGVIDHLVTNIIGTGIKPLSQAADPTIRKAIQELWTRWTDESDADGLLDWYGQQAQAVRACLEGGEVFVRQRPRFQSDGLSVPLQVQVVEPELCPHRYNALLPNGNRVRAGIEFSPIGRRLAYYFYPQRTGDLIEIDRSQVLRVSSDVVQHMYDPQRPGQLRGIPYLTRILIRLFGMDKMDDATLLRQQLANMFVAFLTRPSNTGDAEATHPMTGLPPETDANGRDMLSLEPGIFQELEPGEDVKFSTPPDVSPAYGDFMRQQLYHISASTGVPYETLTGDLSRVNDRTVRVILSEFRRKVMMYQHQLVAFQLCKPLWYAWLNRAYLSGAIELPSDYATDPEPYAAVKWVPQGWPYINPVQDIQAQQSAVRSGLDSRSNLVSEQGEDAEAIDAQQKVDNDRADQLGLRYDSDGRQALKPKTSSDEQTPPDPAGAVASIVSPAAPIHISVPVTVSGSKATRTTKRVERNDQHQITAVIEESVEE